jgi:hypothetical protein
MTFSGNPFFKVKSGYFEWTGLIAVAAADAPFLIDYYISPGQLSNSPYRADAGASRLNAVLARPVFINRLFAVFRIGPEIDHKPVVSRKIRLPVGHQFVPLHLEFIPAFTGRHTPLATDAAGCIHQFAISLRLGTGKADGPQGCGSRSTSHDF